MRHRLLPICSWLALLVASTIATARAATPAVCAPDAAPDKYRMLRQLTLDLFGRIPTYDEYQALADKPDVDAPMIDAMFTNDEYFTEIRSYFRHLVWGGLPDDFNVVGSQRLATRRATTLPYFVGNLRTTFRGSAAYECADRLQTAFDPDGRPIAEVIVDATCPGGSCKQEGYVMLTPYWSPATPIKVCAFDAQSLTLGTGTVPPACGPYTINAGCGCGPGLKYCVPAGLDPSHVAIRDSLSEESTRIFEAIVREGRSYLETFTTTQSFVNGPLVHFYGDLSGPAVTLKQGGAIGYDGRMSTLPAIPFSDRTTWMPVTRDGVHAGVLTTSGFLLRFGSNRGRVNRFYSAFRCEPFLPPAGGLPPDTGGIPDPNLRTRAGCNGCHETIEKAAAHWGRWRNTSTTGYLSAVDVDFSAARAECAACTATSCPAFCDAYFITAHNSTNPDELAAWKGWPQARAYLDATEAMAIETGPSGLVDQPEEQARVAECAVRTLAQQLFGRELTVDETLHWLPTATTAFAATNYNWKTLYRTLVDLPQYRITR
jgi:hypothetical protein